MCKSATRLIIGIGIVVGAVLVSLPIVSCRPPLRVDDVLAAYDEGSAYRELTVVYPRDGTLFPPEIPSPTFRWQDSDSGSNAWLVRVRFQDGADDLNVPVKSARWTPSDQQWEAVKRRSLEQDAEVTVIGVNRAVPNVIHSSASVTIRTSRDPVGAPLFYREVPLPFEDAVRNPTRIRWRFGEISSESPPPVVLERLPVCGNCHSFSADGSLLGMDVDYARDKGTYAIVQVEEEMVLARSKLITWRDYEREEKDLTSGLLSQFSPGGRYVVGTVKDQAVFVAKEPLAFSQLFFPLKGILAVYDRAQDTFEALPGADDREYVQSNPAWSPDGKCIVFARAKARPLEVQEGRVLMSREECRVFLDGEETFLFDLYRIPFNDGRGGEAEPLEGASHNGMSNYFAKYSPDGKWIVFCKAKSFMLLQPDSQLYIIPAEGGEARRMRCNTPLMNSWHTWSPNGRWLAFSSKANGPFTQLFLTHVDEQGNDTPAVVLDRLLAPKRAVNIPEFVNASPDAIRRIQRRFADDLTVMRTALDLMKSGDYQGAAKLYRKALDINPENPKAHQKLAKALTGQGKLEEAVVHHREALRIRPGWEAPRADLESALEQLEERRAGR